MRTLAKLTTAAVFGASVLAVTATTASAAIVCNRAECWHVKRAYAYQPAFGVTVHPNNWRWGAKERFVWREHPGRGYWRDGAWIRF